MQIWNNFSTNRCDVVSPPRRRVHRLLGELQGPGVDVDRAPGVRSKVLCPDGVHLLRHLGQRQPLQILHSLPKLKVFPAVLLVEEFAEVLPARRVHQQLLQAKSPPLHPSGSHLPGISKNISLCQKFIIKNSLTIVFLGPTSQETPRSKGWAVPGV